MSEALITTLHTLTEFNLLQAKMDNADAKVVHQITKIDPVLPAFFQQHAQRQQQEAPLHLKIQRDAEA